MNPIPKLKEKAKTTRFLLFSPQRLNISNPLTIMFANIIMVQPPKTELGSVAIKVPNTGNNPAKIMIAAPEAMAILLTTYVIATRPTFWLKDVIGMQPIKEDRELTIPSHAIEPAISFSLTVLPSPEAAIAEVSPIVSVAETRKISMNAMMASGLNSNETGSTFGRENTDTPSNPEKSTIPSVSARR